MNKKELISALYKRGNLDKEQSEKAISDILDIITEELKKGERINISGFGCLEVVTHKEKIGRNPATGDQMIIPSFKTVKFKVGKNLKDIVNE